VPGLNERPRRIEKTSAMDRRALRLTQRRLSVAALAALAAFTSLPAFASEQSDVVAKIHQFIDGFNRGDAKTALAACAPSASIIDEFPPHEWEGDHACADWANAYAADAKRAGITDGIVRLGEPWYLSVTGARAYAVVPAKYAFKEHGKPVTEQNSIFTVALKKTSTGWLITGWAWSKH
jgi:hypothetical protein